MNFKVEAVNSKYYHSNASTKRETGDNGVTQPHATVLIRSHAINTQHV